jgi:hypothetical protein
MNKRGHSQTLVAAHPGNKNALKTGVFSPATLAPRIRELELEIAARPAQEVVEEILRWEVAALTRLVEAMDQSLEEEGIRGRRGEIRALVNLRLRAGKRLCEALEEYKQAVADGSEAVVEVSSSDTATRATEAQAPEALTESIARFHKRASIDAVHPGELDPQAFLRAVIITSDTSVEWRERRRARAILTQRDANRPSTCACYSTLAARDALEFRDWSDQLREIGVEQAPEDPHLAVLVRRHAKGERLEPWAHYRKTISAIDSVVREGVERVRSEEPAEVDDRYTGEGDAAIAPFWSIVLSPSKDVTAKDRLDSFIELDRMEVLPRCTCKPKGRPALIEDEVDAWRAHAIRLVTKMHYRAATWVARYPETYNAVRDAIDETVVSELPSPDSDVNPGAA